RLLYRGGPAPDARAPGGQPGPLRGAARRDLLLPAPPGRGDSRACPALRLPQARPRDAVARGARSGRRPGALLARWRRPGRRGGGPPRRVPHRPRRSRHRVAAGHGAAPAGLRRPRHAARAADHQCGRGPGGGTGAGLPAAGLAGGQPERRGRRPVMVRAVEVVRRFRRLRALVIGDAMLDSYLEGTAARLCTEGPVPVVRKTAEERVPGGAANTAANLRALGAEVVLDRKSTRLNSSHVKISYAVF